MRAFAHAVLFATAALVVRNAAKCGPGHQPLGNVVAAEALQECETHPLAFLWPRGCKLTVRLTFEPLNASHPPRLVLQTPGFIAETDGVRMVQVDSAKPVLIDGLGRW